MKEPELGVGMRLAVLVSIGLLIFPYSAVPAENPPEGGMTDEELLFMEVPVVVTAARREQPVSETPAAVFVITAEEIRRSGMTTLPELLRMVPGLDVAQIDGNMWGVGSRGFNDRFANKLLVMIDGRSVYTTTFAGVNWDVQNVVLEDVERIEVIRGPGGTMWGANAVNGVINVITKNAKETQGGLAAAGTGNIEQADGAIRYGGRLGDSGYFRVYGRGFKRDPFPDSSGDDAHDALDGKQAGFRFDAAPPTDDVVMLQGNLYEGNSDDRRYRTILTPPSTITVDNTRRNGGGHLLLRWQRRLGRDSDAALQAYFDRADITRTEGEDERVETSDVDFQHRFPLTPGQQFIWGLGYRRVESRFHNESISFTPPHRHTDLFSAFVQDEITVRENVLFTVGSKFEHNSFTGFEYQPNGRLLWDIRQNQALWAAVSRAVRTPSLLDRDIRVNIAAIPGSPPSLMALEGNSGFQSEELLAFEAGYRGEISSRVAVDAAVFYNRYDHLQTLEPGAPFVETDPSPPHLLIPLQFDNRMEGDTYGLEIAARWRVADRWRLTPGYTWLKTRLRLDQGSADTDSESETEGSSPEHQFHLLSRLDLTNNLELDASLFYVDRLASPDIPGYFRLDLRVGWLPKKNWEFSITGQNLLDLRHPEFSAVDLIPSEAPRSVYGRLTWRFP